MEDTNRYRKTQTCHGGNMGVKLNSENFLRFEIKEEIRDIVLLCCEFSLVRVKTGVT